MLSQLYKVTALLFITQIVFAQSLDPTICIDRLEEAKRSYRAGLLSEVKDKIEDCLSERPKIFSREKMVEGYKLLTESFLFRNEIGESTISYENLLKFNPLFEADSTDPDNSYDLIYLSRTYRRKPLISAYVNLGTNYTMVQTLQNYNTDNNNRPAQNYKQVTVGFNTALGVEIPVWRDFTVAIEGNFAMRSYLFADTMYLTSNLLNPRQADYQYSLLQFNERQFYIDIPVMVRYEHYLKKFKKIIPYAYIGAAPNFLLSSNLVNINRSTSRETLGGGAVVGGEVSIPIAGPGLTVYGEENGVEALSLRNYVNVSGIIGIGSKFRIGRDFLIVEARYNRMLLNSVNMENRYSNRELVYQFGYVDNDFRIDNFSISVGFEKSFYKPRKKVKYNPELVDRRLDQLLKREKNNAKRTTDAELKRELNSFIRDLERDKPGILEDVQRGRASSNVIREAAKQADKIKEGR
jgi:hypothetical protein